jgi:hypothetical protein
MIRPLVIGAQNSCLSGPAFAHTIDGDWCSAQGPRGPTTTIPSGTASQGNYHWHQFDYVVPASDADAGSEIHLQLLSEDFMILTRMKDGKASEPAMWNRCQVSP